MSTELHIIYIIIKHYPFRETLGRRYVPFIITVVKFYQWEKYKLEKSWLISILVGHV